MGTLGYGFPFRSQKASLAENALLRAPVTPHLTGSGGLRFPPSAPTPGPPTPRRGHFSYGDTKVTRRRRSRKRVAGLVRCCAPRAPDRGTLGECVWVDLGQFGETSIPEVTCLIGDEWNPRNCGNMMKHNVFFSPWGFVWFLMQIQPFPCPQPFHMFCSELMLRPTMKPWTLNLLTVRI